MVVVVGGVVVVVVTAAVVVVGGGVVVAVVVVTAVVVVVVVDAVMVVVGGVVVVVVTAAVVVGCGVVVVVVTGVVVVVVVDAVVVAGGAVEGPASPGTADAVAVDDSGGIGLEKVVTAVSRCPESDGVRQEPSRMPAVRRIANHFLRMIGRVEGCLSNAGRRVSAWTRYRSIDGVAQRNR